MVGKGMVWVGIGNCYLGYDCWWIFWMGGVLVLIRWILLLCFWGVGWVGNYVRGWDDWGRKWWGVGKCWSGV